MSTSTRHIPTSVRALGACFTLALGVLVAWPVLTVFSAAIFKDGGLDLSAFSTVFSTPYLARSLLHSVVVSLGGTALAVSLALLLMWTVWRTRLPGRAIFNFFAMLPLVSPPVVLSMALLLLLGKQGLLTPTLASMFGFTDIYGPVGICLAMGLTYLPHAAMILATALARLDTPVEEAARSLGARYWTLLRRVSLPMAMPAIVRATLTVFILCMTDFGNPMMIGGDYKVAAVYLFDLIYRSADELPVSAALGVIVVIPCATAWLLARRLAGQARLTAGSRGGRAEAPPTDLPPSARLLFGGGSALVSLAIAALYAVITFGAFVQAVGADHTLTLRWFDPATPGSGWELLAGTVRLAVIAAAIGAPVAILIAWLTERARVPGGWVLSALTLTPAALPGVIFGLGWLLAFHAPPLPLTHTPWILILCLATANLYVGVMAGATALQKIDPAEEEAAQALGARGMTPFFRVVLPQLATAAVSAFFFIFVRGMISLSAVVFLVSASHSVISVSILGRGEAGDYGLACAMAVQVLAVVGLAQGALAGVSAALRHPREEGGAARLGDALLRLWPWRHAAGSPARTLRLGVLTAASAWMLVGLAHPSRDELNVVGAFDEDEFHEYLEAFREEHPDLEVRGQRLSSGQLVTRLIFERENPGFDVVFGLIDIYLEQLRDHEVLEPWLPAAAAALPDKYKDPGGRYFQLDLLLIALGVNTEVMAQRGLPVPRTWEELADPRYRGLVGVASPAASGTALTIFSRLVDMFRPDPWSYLGRLDQNVFQYTSSGAAPGKQASQGEVGVGITFDFPLHKRKAEGYPLEVVYPDRIPYTVEGAALLKGARHPVAARQFLEWAANPGGGLKVIERRKARVTHPAVPVSDPWKQDIPMERLYELSAPFDPDALVQEWARRYAR